MSLGMPVAIAEVEESLEPWSLGVVQGTLVIAPGHQIMGAMKEVSLGGTIKMRATWEKRS